MGTITGYKVYYAASTINDLNAAGVESETSTGTGTSMTITGLTAGTRYYFKVAAVTGIGEGTASLEADTYTNGVPGEPARIQAAATGAEELTITWDESSPGYYAGSETPISYRVYYKIGSLTEADLSSLNPEVVDAGKDLSQVLTNLQADSTYSVTVIAVNDVGSSAMPESIEAVPFGADRSPGAAASVTITSSTESEIELSWTAPIDTGIINGDGTQGIITAYTIYYSKTQGFIIDGNTAKKDVDNTTPTTTASIDSLNSGTQYYFKVTAENATGSGNASDEADGYTTSKPGAPTIVAADPGTAADNEVTLTWDAPGDTGIKDLSGVEDEITGYKVYYAESTITDLSGGGVTGVDAQGTPHKITGLTPGTQYYFRVTANNGKGEGTALFRSRYLHKQLAWYANGYSGSSRRRVPHSKLGCPLRGLLRG